MGEVAQGPLLLAIDGGTESVRVALFDGRGIMAGSAAEPYATTFPHPGWAEQQPEEWWAALAKAVPACLDRAGARANEIAAISLDATTCTLLALDAHGRPLRPALLWMDVRAGRQAAAINRTGHPALAFSPTGTSAEWMPAKVAWLAEHEPETYAATAHLLEYTDWLVWRLTGRLALNLCTTTQRWYYNGRDGGWPAGLYSAIGLPGVLDRVPLDVVPVGALAGGLCREAAVALGLLEGTPLFEGGSDAFIGLLGLGVAGPGQAGLITGSSNVLGALTASEVHAPGLFGAYPDALVPGLCVVEAGQVSTGSVLAWFRRVLAPDLPPASAYRVLDAEAARVPPGANGLVALDYFQGNRSPHTDALARGAVWGLTLGTSRAELFRAFMEAIAFGTSEILENFAANGLATETIVACGGATRSELFMQIYADVCGHTITTAAVPDAPLLGGAIVAAAGLGLYRDLPAAAEAMVRPDRTYFPEIERHQAYRAGFRRYRDTYRQLRVLMHESAPERS